MSFLTHGKWLAFFSLLIVIALTACGSSEKKTITLGGSTTLQPLADKFAGAFNQKYPDITVTVTGGGSSVGVASASNGIVDLGMVSRELTPDESPVLKTSAVARDGIALIVHPSNPIKQLSLAQIKDVYSGNITNWSQLGGNNASITIISREEGSGTRDMFEQIVMLPLNAFVSQKAIFQSSNGAVETAVAGDPDSIGYISVGYLDTSVKALDIDGITATAQNVKNNIYPISRSLYYISRKTPSGIVKEFIDFCQSDEGQKIVEEEGYVSLPK